MPSRDLRLGTGPWPESPCNGVLKKLGCSLRDGGTALILVSLSFFFATPIRIQAETENPSYDVDVSVRAAEKAMHVEGSVTIPSADRATLLLDGAVTDVHFTIPGKAAPPILEKSTHPGRDTEWTIAVTRDVRALHFSYD